MKLQSPAHTMAGHVGKGGVEAKTEPAKSETLSRLESIELETRPLHLELKTKTKKILQMK